MVSHTRSRSKGSFSIFSFDTIRSFSRAGSRQASRIPSKDELRDRTESSLSHRCDPNDQPPASPEPIAPNDVVEGSAQELGNRAQDQQPQGEAETTVQQFHSTRRRAHRLRPKSWLSFSRLSSQSPYPRSISTQLPKTSSTSTVARSVISAPVLTSTTNVSVARAERVHCGEISDVAFAQSTWNSQVGWVATSNQDPGETRRDAKASDGPHGESLGPPTGLTTPKRGRILRLKNAIRSRVRNGTSHPQSVTAQQEHDPETVGDVEGDQDPTLKRDLSRRRAETVNLYKGKIKRLTGHGHIRRKSVIINKGAAEPRGGESPLLGRGDIIDVPTTDLAAEHSDNESAFGSLTRSFASAVDKLDFYSSVPHNMPFLKSRSSFFFPKKGEKGVGNRDEARRQFPPISPSKPAPPVAQAIAASSQSNLLKTLDCGGHPQKLHSTPRPAEPHNPETHEFKPDQEDNTAQQAAVAPVVFSAEKNGYVPAAPRAGCPRGVNPLRMHPPGAMAVAPSVPYRAVQALPVDRDALVDLPRGRTATPNSEDREGSDTTSLEDAPIYSPSLGDLSQYARDTPRSTRAVPTGSSRDQKENTPSARSPVKKDLAVKGHVGPLKKSRSGVGLFSRSKAEKPSTTANRNGAEAESPLYQRDGYQQGRSDNGNGRTVKKSKSLHFGGLFKRKDPSDVLPTMASSAFQPATPSPLRKVMRFGSQSTRGGGNSPTAPSAKK
ncbi:uncharacterized protein Z520_12393 [Fonsecaea multimorphosa CBS 102226]|uniref:Uncharacterized protein n=1 Tax=Fonsecaea multimorphosa CBS 102226 TaxID=1442371 RepID=A0A0D2JN67_9EURO|nr:uncharacterized protein Z520_12393 [Fonsecaea multimorphosa CBS 102226]KIX91904.1 hypothetical protein Z520_12393 [Fonsecaea multimorphosa CBS 102226]OAL17226.1 hypothetical protein AYO22_11791 [Fonsecaea multimorphosa]